MRKSIINIIMLLFVCFIPLSSYADPDPNDPNYVLHVQVTNATNEKITFNRFDILLAFSEYSIDRQSLNPGEKAVVTVKKSTIKHNDVGGNVIFVDSKGNEITLYIHDCEQVHQSASYFQVAGPKYTSKFNTQPQKNTNRKPRYLSYLDVDLRVIEKTAG